MTAARKGLSDQAREPAIELAECYLEELSFHESNRAAFRAAVLARAFFVLFDQVEGAKNEKPVELRLMAWGADIKVPASLTGCIDTFCQVPTGSADELRFSIAHRLGELLDLLLASEKSGERRRLGSYYTPVGVARALMERSFAHVVPRLEERLELQRVPLLFVCDPACGGGAFLIEALRQIARYLIESGRSAEQALQEAAQCAHGIDVSPLAIATTEASLFLLHPAASRLGHQLFEGDALLDAPADQHPRAHALLSGLDVGSFFPASAYENVFSSDAAGFDWVVGNPPWVAFQGRATQPITAERRSFYRARYASFSGYPTTQGMFAQRASEMAPHGVISLLVPSSLSDLDGYAQARRVVTSGHVACEPLLEFGQDAFVQVVQPCFGLVAVSRSKSGEGSTRPFALEERARLAGSASRIEPPQCLDKIAQLPLLPPSTFGELGFQSNSKVVSQLFLRGSEPQAPFTLGLLEGRCVREFSQSRPRVFLNPDQSKLKMFKARLRDESAYLRVDFVVRQTAAYTIAARHQGQFFRNSLIAGYASADLDPDLLVGLLNSALYRCIHLSRQRDARQATFPQVKVAHLRRLPAPPADKVAEAEQVASLSRAASAQGGMTETERAALDHAVFSLFSLNTDQQQSIIDYLLAREGKALRPSL